MKLFESLLGAPFVVTVLTTAQITLRGRADAQDVVVDTAAQRVPIDPVFGLFMVGVLLLSGIVLVVREMVVEARERDRGDLQSVRGSRGESDRV